MQLLNLLNPANEVLFNSTSPGIGVMRSVHFIFFLSISLGQWTTFKLDELSDLAKDSAALYRTAGFAIAHNYTIDIKGDNRIALGGSILKGLPTNGFLPSIQGQVKVSWNLALRGRMAAYSGKEGAVQMFGWGLSLRPGKEEEPSKWIVNFDAGRLNSHDELKVSAVQASAVREFVWNKFPINYGFGMNISQADSYANAETNHLGKKEIQTNFILIGTTAVFMGLAVKPQIWFGSQFAVFSISFVGTF